MKRKTLVLLAGGLAIAAAGLWLLLQPSRRPSKELLAVLQGITDRYRKIIILMDGAELLDESTLVRCRAAGRDLFWAKQRALDDLGRKLAEDPEAKRQFIQHLTASPALRDADKLAFLDLVEELAIAPGAGEPVKRLLEELQSIQLAYREEVTRIFSQFGTRGAAGTRDKWAEYLRYLKSLTSREKILEESGNALPDEVLESLRGDSAVEVFGHDFAPKTIALTFDDGPHPRYTEQVLALLRKYGVKACFFEIGRNLGAVDGPGQVKLAPTAEISRRVLAAGHVLANHTYSHRPLVKLSEAERAQEIHATNLLLAQVAGRKPELFRAPYGARNQQILQRVTAEGLRSVMWSIDSLDWADPIPESIAMRVLRALSRSPKGIVLFHDIHKQSVMALPPVLEELQRQNYSFLSFENGLFAKSGKPAGAARAIREPAAVGADARPNFYRESWAIIIGINDYQRWPKLRYSVNDANAIEEALISRFGFKRENVYKLLDGEATRQRIMELLGDQLTDGKKVQREDRVFFFFAGHGATRTLGDGRQIGFIVPADADRSSYYSTSISMSALREACDLIPAKHMYFVMDSCYSGLALTRGAGAFARDRTYLEEITRRTARQILTAGGADQQVADDGPNGHSVFTWALLQGLQGPADLDQNGVITASELGAYISPVVASFSRQTPAVGNLVGSEGGEFLFELRPEPLTELSQQLDGKALHLNDQLAALQKEIAAKQAELLRLQQSVRAESAKLAQLAGSGAAVRPPERTRSHTARAFDLDRQGRQFYREKRYDQALQKLQEAVALKPGDPVLLNNLGFICYKMGRHEEALKYLEKTLAMDPRRKEAHGNIADAYLKLGRRDKAKAHYEQYLALFPASPRGLEVRRILQTLD